MPGPPKQLPPFTRECPSCGATITHHQRQNRNTARRLKRICKACEAIRRQAAYSGAGNPFYGKKHSEETIARFKAREHPHVKTEEFKELRRRQMTANNTMQGRSVYEAWVEKHGREKADQLRDELKAKHSFNNSGESNPMHGKPAPQGSGNGWCGWYKGWFFRSLRELSFMVLVIEKGSLDWRSAETSELRIPYIDFRGRSRTYTADFLIDGRILVEIKPKRLHDSPTVKSKRMAAEDFCRKAGLEYQIVDITPLSDLDIAALHDGGLILFTKRYEAKYQERFHK